MIYNIILALLSTLALWFVSETVVSAAERLARGTGISQFVVGITIASVGTSLPEIGNSIAAGLDRLNDLPVSDFAVGNIISANLGQITLILGIVGLFATLTFRNKELVSTGAAMLLAIAILWAFSFDGVITRTEGIIMIAVYLSYLAFMIMNGRKDNKVKKEIELKKAEKRRWFLITDLFIAVGGLLIILFFAKMIVNNAVTIAKALQISTYLIGFLVGIGTSLPELTISLKSALKGSSGLSLGNLLGSNITDPLLSLSAGALISDLLVKKEILLFDIPFWFFSTIIALVFLSNKFDKKKVFVLFGLYGLFIYIKLIF